MLTNQLLKKQDVVDVTEEFFDLANARNLKTSIKPLRTQFEEYQAGQFRLIVVGEVKKGKSSFVNALLGEPELLPVDAPVTTSTVYRLMYGDTEEYQVFFNPSADGETQKEPIYIDREELIDYGTEDGNPNNEKEVDHIAIELPNPLLQSGVIITDTPGLGGLFAEHGDITLKNAPTADAVCFVVDSVETEVTREEVEHLKKFLELPTELQGTPPSLFFVQTKTDVVPEEHWQQYRERNLEILSEQLAVDKETLHYFPVSAKLKHAADQESDSALLQYSGFPQLLDFFSTTLLREKEERLARKLLPPIRETAEKQLLPTLDEEKNVFATESKAELDGLLQGSKETQKRFRDWIQNEMPKSIANFENSAADLKRETANRLQNDLDFAPTAPIVKSIVDDLKAQDLSADELQSKSESIQTVCGKVCQAIHTDILAEYQEKMGGLMAQVADELGSSLERCFAYDIPGITPISPEILESYTSRFATIRELAYAPLMVLMLGGAVTTVGSLFGAGVVATLAAITSFVALPIMLVGLAAACIYYAWRDNRKRAQMTAIRDIQGHLSNAVRDAQRQAVQSFNEVSTALERGFKEYVTEIGDEISAEQERKQAEINESRKQTNEAKSQKIGEVEANIKRAKELISKIGMMLRSGA